MTREQFWNIDHFSRLRDFCLKFGDDSMNDVIFEIDLDDAIFDDMVDGDEDTYFDESEAWDAYEYYVFCFRERENLSHGAEAFIRNGFLDFRALCGDDLERYKSRVYKIAEERGWFDQSEEPKVCFRDPEVKKSSIF